MKSFKVLKDLFILLCVISSLSLFGQYERQFQGKYHGGQLINTNFTLTPNYEGTGYWLPIGMNISTCEGYKNIVMTLFMNDLNFSFYCIDAKYLRSGFETFDIEKTIDGGYIICGMHYNPEDTLAFIAKYTGLGSNLWIKTYEGVHHFDAITTDIKYTGVGESYIVCGQTDDEIGRGVIVRIMDETPPLYENGAVAWAMVIKDKDIYSEYHDIVTLPDGNFAMTGVYLGKAMYTVIDNTASVVNNACYYFNGPFQQAGYGITINPNNDEKVIYIVGRTLTENSSDVLVDKIDYMNGDVLFSRAYDVGGTGEEIGNSIKIYGSNFYVTGNVIGHHMDPIYANSDGFILKSPIHIFGSAPWLRIYGTERNEYLYEIFRNNTNDGFIASGRDDMNTYIVENYDQYNEECESIRMKVKFDNLSASKGEFNLDAYPVTRVSPPKLDCAATMQFDLLCPKISTGVKSSDVLNTVSLENLNEFKIYPSYTNDHLFVKGIEGNYSYRIYSIQGSVVSNGQLEISSTTQIDVSSLKQGLYNIVFYSDKGNYSEKFIKQ